MSDSPAAANALHEYSVVFTDRATNHMSPRFGQVMRDISAALKRVYRGHATALVPGGGSYGMEAVARQFAHGQTCLVLRNGWFSYRWSQIFVMGNIPGREVVCPARPVSDAPQAPWAPAPIEEIEAAIDAEKPSMVFAPQVETASGIVLPDDYLQRVGAAVRRVGGLFVLDCIASGALWVDMLALGVDVLISAPQKSWSGPACAAMVVLSEAASDRLEHTTSSSFAADLKRWRDIMAAYEAGGHAYHATLPTDALCRVRDAMGESMRCGLEELTARQWQLGRQVRGLLAQHGFSSVAAPGFEAPGVVVCHTDSADIHSGAAFARHGLQTAAGVPLMCGEPDGFKTFRLGLFGLDKWRDVDATVGRLRNALDKL